MYNDLLYCKKLAYNCQYVLDWLDPTLDNNNLIHFPPAYKILFVGSLNVQPHGGRHVIFYETNNKNNYFFCKRDLFNLLPQFINNQSTHIFFVVDGDPHFTQTELNLLLQTKFIHCYAQHLTIEHPKLTPYPVGLSISYNCEEQQMRGILCHLSKSKNNNVYVNFQPNNLQRKQCLEQIKFPNQFNPLMCKINYFLELSNSYFCLSPSGSGGIFGDAYRTWESLYCNTVPVVNDNPIHRYFQKFFPILIINNWKDANDLTKTRYEDIMSNYLDSVPTGSWKDYLNFSYLIKSNYLRHQVINL